MSQLNAFNRDGTKITVKYTFALVLNLLTSVQNIVKVLENQDNLIDYQLKEQH